MSVAVFVFMVQLTTASLFLDLVGNLDPLPPALGWSPGVGLEAF